MNKEEFEDSIEKEVEIVKEKIKSYESKNRLKKLVSPDQYIKDAYEYKETLLTGTYFNMINKTFPNYKKSPIIKQPVDVVEYIIKGKLKFFLGVAISNQYEYEQPYFNEGIEKIYYQKSLEEHLEIINKYNVL